MLGGRELPGEESDRYCWWWVMEASAGSESSLRGIDMEGGPSWVGMRENLLEVESVVGLLRSASFKEEEEDDGRRDVVFEET
jgi:hypothetical protein